MSPSLFVAEGWVGPTRWAITGRAPQVGAAPYTGLNLGSHVGDAPGQVAANRATLAAALGLTAQRLVVMDQVHGADVVVVAGPGPVGPAAAMVTVAPDLALLVLVADCVPVLLVDPEGPGCGVVHAGRNGLAAGVVPAAVSALRGLGVRRPHAIVGPSVCGRCYEVPWALRESVAAAHPSARTVSWTGTPALDVAAAVVAELSELDVSLTWLPGCTREDDLLYSHRRGAPTGRFAGLVRTTGSTGG